MGKNQSKNALLYLCLAKICLIYVIIYASFHFFNFNLTNYKNNFVYPIGDPVSLLSAFTTWDAKMYYYIADYGYAPLYHNGQPFFIASAFYPLYPYLMSFVSKLVASPLVAGFLISNFCFIVGVHLFYAYVRREFSEKIAKSATLLLILFPTSFYFSLVYTESLFFMLLMLVFAGLRKDRYKTVFIASCLLGLTKAVGLFLAFILAYEFFLKRKAWRKPASYVLSMAPVLGFLLSQFIVSTFTGDFSSSFKAQGFFASQNSIQNLFSPITWFVSNFIEIDLVLHSMNSSLIDRGFFVFYLVCLFLLFKEKNWLYLILALFLGLLPALMGNFAGYSRYLLVVFPMFVVLAKCLEGRRLVATAMYTVFSCLQIYFIARYALFEWVS